MSSSAPDFDRRHSMTPHQARQTQPSLLGATRRSNLVGVEPGRRDCFAPLAMTPVGRRSPMPMIPVAGGAALHCAVDDYLWPWDTALPVVMMHGFARNARFWNRWVPPVAETRRVYRPDLLGVGESDLPPAGYRYTPETIAAQVIGALDALGL